MNNINYIKTTIDGLKIAIRGNTTYVGSSTNPDIKNYIMSKSSPTFGKCHGTKFSTCFWSVSINMNKDEQELLTLYPTCNLEKKSNAQNIAGIIYVLV